MATLTSISKRIDALEGVKRDNEPPDSVLCEFSELGESEESFNKRLAEMSAADGIRRIGYLVVDGRVSD